MEKFKNYLIAILIVGIIALALILNHISKSKEVLFKELIGQKQEFVKISKNQALLEIKYEENLAALKEAEEAVKHLKGRITVLSDATYLIKEQARKSNKSDLIHETADGSYLVNEIRFNDGPAVGFVTISKDGQVFSKMYDHEISVSNSVAVDELTGRYSILNEASWTLKSPALTNGWFNKPYPLEIVSGTALVDPTIKERPPRIYFWNPRLAISGQISKNSGLGLGVSLASYGSSKLNSKYKFLELGMTYKNEKVLPYVAPFLWKPMHHLLPNTYVGTFFIYDDGFKPYFGINLNL